MIKTTGSFHTAIERNTDGSAKRTVLIPRPSGSGVAAGAAPTARMVGAGSAPLVDKTAARRSATFYDPRRAAATERHSDEETMETAASPGSGLGLPAGSSTSNINAPAMLIRLLDGFVPLDSPQQMNALYREIYAYDPISGSAVDLLSTFPLGEFSLNGGNDEKRLRTFAQSVESIRLKQLLPALNRDFLVLGKFLGTLTWDEKQKIFSAISPQNIDWAQIESVPIYGETPIIRFQMPGEIRKLLTSGKPEFERFRDRLPAEFLEGGSGSVLLNPDDVMFIPRDGMTTDYGGVSYFRRVLPVWLIEKALIRGTMDQFWRRQRAILHLVLGGGSDDWKPSADDYRTVTDLFLAADHDPTGAVVATRDQIMVQEIRRGDDFLKWPDVSQWAEQVKLRALGLSESLFGSDMSVAVAEGAISIALQFFQGHRDMITQKVFYDKIFPAIAVANRYRKRHDVVLASAGGGSRDGVVKMRGYDMNNIGGQWTANFGGVSAEYAAASGMPDLSKEDLQKYSIPTVQWHTSLDPQNSTSERLDALMKLSDQGLPIPLRMWASTLGMRLEDIAEQKDSDIKNRDFFREWKKEVMKDQVGPDGQPIDGGGDDGGDVAEASSARLLPGYGSTGSGVGIANRRFDPEKTAPKIERGAKMVTRSRTERQSADFKINKALVEASTNVLVDSQRRENAAFRERAARKHYTSPRKPTKK